MINPIRLLHLTAWLLLVPPVDPADGFPCRLERITTNGLHKYDEQSVIATSGLKPGATVSASDLQQAAGRLGKTGYFASVGYEYRWVEGSLECTFNLKEPDRFFPCVLDNFVWFGNEELEQSLRARVPLFSGTATILEGNLDYLASNLQAILTERRIRARVEYVPGCGSR